MRPRPRKHTRALPMRSGTAGVSTVTITHDVTGAPMVAGIVSAAAAGVGWRWLAVGAQRSQSLLETGTRMPT